MRLQCQTKYCVFNETMTRPLSCCSMKLVGRNYLNFIMQNQSAESHKSWSSKVSDHTHLCVRVTGFHSHVVPKCQGLLSLKLSNPTPRGASFYLSEDNGSSL